MARFQYDPARLNYTLQQNGREYNLRLSQRSQAIFNTLMHLLPSNWISTVKGPNYSVELSAVATELARLELALQDINTDEYFATVRSDFLYQVVGYMLFNGQLPKLDYSDTEFRKFFIALISIYFQGAVPVAIEDAAKLLAFLGRAVQKLALRSRQHLQFLKQLIHVGFNRCPDVEGVGLTIIEGEHVRPDDILDEDIISCLFPIAVDDGLSALQHLR